MGRSKTKCSFIASPDGSGVQVAVSSPKGPGTFVLIVVTARLGVSVIVGRRVLEGIGVGARVVVRVGVAVSVCLGVAVGGIAVGVGGIGVEDGVKVGVNGAISGIGVHDDRTMAVSVRSGIRVGSAARTLWQAAKNRLARASRVSRNRFFMRDQAI